MASRSTNTMSEALQGLLKDVSEMKLMPDADLNWLVNLETIILQKAREPIQRMQEQGLTNAVVPNEPVPPQAPMGGPGGGMPPGVPGVSQSPNMPNGDELRRMFQT